MAEFVQHVVLPLNVDFRQFTNNDHPNHGELDILGMFKKLVGTDIEVIHELLDLSPRIEEYHRRLRIAKTTGTTVGAAGAVSMVAGLCLAPLTGGTSAMLTMGGLMATATSGVAAISSDIVNHIKSKKFREKIKQLQEKQVIAAIELTQQLQLLDYAIDVLEEAGINQEVAVRTALQWLKDSVLEFFRSPSGQFTVPNLSVAVSSLTRHLNGIRDLAASAAALVGTNTQALGTVARETTVALTEVASKVGEVTITEIKNLRQLIKSAGQSMSATTGKSVAKGVGIAAGLIFTVVDIAVLLRDWNSPHPLLATIESIVQDLIKDIDKCEDSMFLLQRLENWGRCELDRGI